MTVELRIEDLRWESVDLQRLASVATEATLTRNGLDAGDWDIALLASDDMEVADLNARFRGKHEPTNVLSWPASDLSPDHPGGTPYPPNPAEPELGDIAIAFETCLSEAEAANLTLADHLVHLIVHGTLHLLGYDHTHNSDAEIMERLEVEILATLGVADPY